MAGRRSGKTAWVWEMFRADVHKVTGVDVGSLAENMDRMYIKEFEMFLGYFDDDEKKSVAERFEDAVNRYKEKFGKEPVVALVNPDQAAELGTEALGVTVRPTTYIRLNHFWVGADDTEIAP